MKKFWFTLAVGITLLALPGLVQADTILYSYMSGDGEVPPTDSPGIGVSIVTLSDDMQTINYFVAFEGLQVDSTVSHIHVGPTDQSGPVIFNFTGIPGTTEGVYFGTLTADDFMPGGGLNTYDDAIAALLNGGTYTNLHSTPHPSGEIRGQLYVFEP